MKSRFAEYTAVGLAGLMVTLSTAADGTSIPQGVEGCVNVMDHVERVGTADHTEAIRQAFAAAGRQHRDELRGKWGIGAVYFPPGPYRISDTINIDGVSEIFGHGASIVQTDPQKDIFFADNVRLLDIHGLSFHGGRDQIALGNRNIANGLLKIRDCHFWHAGRFAGHQPLGGRICCACSPGAGMRDCACEHLRSQELFLP